MRGRESIATLFFLRRFGGEGKGRASLLLSSAASLTLAMASRAERRGASSCSSWPFGAHASAASAQLGDHEQERCQRQGRCFCSLRNLLGTGKIVPATCVPGHPSTDSVLAFAFMARASQSPLSLAANCALIWPTPVPLCSPHDSPHGPRSNSAPPLPRASHVSAHIRRNRPITQAVELSVDSIVLSGWPRRVCARPHLLSLSLCRGSTFHRNAKQQRQQQADE